MEIMKLCDVIIISSALIYMYRLERKKPEEYKQLMAQTFQLALIISSPFCIIELLSVLGFKLMNIPWRITPLDIMASLCIFFYMVLIGKVTKIYKTR